MKTVCLFIYLFISYVSFSQDIATQLSVDVKKLEKDEQFKHAIISFYVVDGKTGKVIFDKNAQTGLAPASCQKVITSVSAFEMLGKEYRYKTYITHDQPINNGILQGHLYFVGGGDPTLGSQRWNTASEEAVIKKIIAILKKNNIQSITGDLVADDSYFTFEPVPKGWVWEDIGNYYGAGAWSLNWRENQFDITFKTGKAEDDPTEIMASKPAAILKEYSFVNFVKTGAKASGDNAYLFSAPFSKNIIVRGTVPPSAEGFTISGSVPNPPKLFLQTVGGFLKNSGISVAGNMRTYTEGLMNNLPVLIPKGTVIDSIVSPTLDSVNYWFLKKSVNLFGEAFVKTIARKNNGIANTDSGINIIKNFWNKKGIDIASLNMIDGSGLSPANRVTANALVMVLQYAKMQSWYASFYNALPLINGIKMKDGYISGVRSYAGYVKSKNGSDYTFCFIVNNFDGSAAAAREKIWSLLDILK